MGTTACQEHVFGPSRRNDGADSSARSLCHELNNILTAISGYAELARLDVPDHSEAGESLMGVNEAVARAREVVRDLLSLSRSAGA